MAEKSHTQRKEPQRWRVVPNFGGRRDHSGRAAWRTRKPPAGTLTIPLSLLSNKKNYERIANRRDVYIFSSAPVHNNGRLFELWGTKSNVESVKREITQWIKHSNYSGNQKRNKSFAKVASLTDSQRAKAEKKWEEEVRRERFRQNPPADMLFSAVGSFHWPVGKWNAKEQLGESYEVLDPIRMDCSCYIVYDDERDLFRVMGKYDNVQKGLQRIRVTCWQIATLDMEALRKHYIHCLPNETQPENIVMVDYESTMNDQANEVERSPRGIGHGNRSPIAVAQETASSHASLKKDIMEKLRSLQFYRGEIELRLHFGTFKILESPKRFHLNEDPCTVSDYKSMAIHTNFKGKVTEEIGDLAIEASVWSALKKSGLIMPLGQVQDLEHVEPVYSAHFTFAEGAKGENRLCLSVGWQKTGSSYRDDYFDIISQKWTRFQGSAPYSVLDASMTNLNTGLAWMFKLNLSEYVEESKLHEKYISFVKSLKFDVRAAQKEKPDEYFIKHNLAVVPIFACQSKEYSYSLASCDYVLSVSQFQNIVLPPSNSKPADSKPRVHSPRLKLGISRGQWAQVFGENSKLEIGTVASWGGGTDEWFPSDSGGDGWNEFMEALQQIEGVVQSSAAKMRSIVTH